jgi:hypothetical protein
VFSPNNGRVLIAEVSRGVTVSKHHDSVLLALQRMRIRLPAHECREGKARDAGRTLTYVVAGAVTPDREVVANAHVAGMYFRQFTSPIFYVPFSFQS